MPKNYNRILIVDRFYDWNLKNCLEININKCKIITFSKKKINILFEYSVNKEKLLRTESICDLGITLDSGLRYHLHIENVLNRAYRLCGFIKRQCKDFTDVTCIINIFNSLVRSILEYCCIIWDPYYQSDIDRLERVQKKIVNFILFKLHIDKTNYSYEARLQLLGITSLKVRRFKIIQKFGFNIINNKIDCIEILQLFNFRVPRFSTRNNDLFYADNFHSNYSSHSPVAKVTSALNNLPANIDVNFCSFTNFLKCISVCNNLF